MGAPVFLLPLGHPPNPGPLASGQQTDGSLEKRRGREGGAGCAGRWALAVLLLKPVALATSELLFPKTRTPGRAQDKAKGSCLPRQDPSLQCHSAPQKTRLP